MRDQNVRSTVVAMGPGVVRELAEVVGSAHVVTDPELLAAHVVDWTGRFRGHSPAMVRPGSTAEVAGVLDVCRRHQVALVPQGGNTGMVGGGVRRSPANSCCRRSGSRPPATSTSPPGRSPSGPGSRSRPCNWRLLRPGCATPSTSGRVVRPRSADRSPRTPVASTCSATAAHANSSSGWRRCSAPAMSSAGCRGS
ncbi:MAG: hypothetical protein R2713_22925 [Ilumatobacteraceae bacterium]